MKYHLMKLLLLLVLYPIFASRTVAQDPYDLEYWSCTPSSCNDDAGPAKTASVSTSIVGLCYNNYQPGAVASSYVYHCADFYFTGLRSSDSL
jgi:hypothetical protein